LTEICGFLEGITATPVAATFLVAKLVRSTEEVVIATYLLSPLILPLY
jgi:hypothetical protein